jgi:hypothetical protein
MSRFRILVVLTAAACLVGAAPSAAADGEPPWCEPGDICYDPPPPPPPPPPAPPPPPPAPPPPPPPPPAPLPPPPPPNGDPWAPGAVPGEGVGNPHPSPGGWQYYGSTCWAKDLMRSEGSGPWTRRLFMYTVWCGRSGRITYRSSSVRTQHDVLCWNSSGPTATRTLGGANFSVVEVQAWVAVTCASIPTGWPNYNDTLMMRVQYFPNGIYRTVAWT